MAIRPHGQVGSQHVNIVVLQFSDAALRDKVLVVQTVFATAMAVLKQPQVVGRILSSMADPFAHENGSSFEHIANV